MALVVVMIVVVMAMMLVAVAFVGIMHVTGLIPVVLMLVALVVVMVVPFVVVVIAMVMIAVIVAVMVVRTGTLAARRRSKVNLRTSGCWYNLQTRKQGRERHSYCHGSRLESPQVWSTSDHTLAIDKHNPSREESG